MVPRDFRGQIRSDDPAMTVSGMVTVTLDTRGRLRRFLAVPRQVRDGAPPQTPPAWDALFTEAGLDLKTFTPSEAAWLPPVPYDSVAGWTGTVPGRPDAVLKVVAAVQQGRPVYFELIAPWSEAAQVTIRPTKLRAKITEIVYFVLSLAFTVAGLYFARRNLRLGRGDKAGAIRLATVVFVLILAGHLLVRHVGPGAGRLRPGVLGEPRRQPSRGAPRRRRLSRPRALLPAALPGAARLVDAAPLRQGSRDPLVGRDHLWGVLAGLVRLPRRQRREHPAGALQGARPDAGPVSSPSRSPASAASSPTSSSPWRTASSCCSSSPPRSSSAASSSGRRRSRPPCRGSSSS